MQNSKRSIKITCTGAATVPWVKLEPLQGDLKELSKDNYARLRKVILEHGFSFPVFVWKDSGKYKTIDGHQRLNVIKTLADEGYDIPELPVVWITAKDEQEAKKKILMAIGRYGKVTDDGLYEFLTKADLKIEDMRDAVELPDIDWDRFDKNFGPDVPAVDVPDPQMERADALIKEYGVERGKIWALGDNRIMCGDSTNEADMKKLMGDKKATLVFTDPPYGVSIGKKNVMLGKFSKGGRNTDNLNMDDMKPEDLKKLLLAVFTNWKKSMADNCSVFVCSPQGGELGIMMMMMMQESGLEVRHIINWIKNTPTFSMGRLDYDYQHEPILFTWTKSHKRIKKGQFQTSLWTVDRPLACKEHPTMKPIELPENAILNHTDEGDIVVDMFSGSGTTMLACEKTKRAGYVTELEPKYVAVAIQRWVDMTGGKPKLIK